MGLGCGLGCASKERYGPVGLRRAVTDRIKHVGPYTVLNDKGPGPSNWNEKVLKKAQLLPAEINEHEPREERLYSKATNIQRDQKIRSALSDINYDGQVRRWSALV